MKEPRCMGVRKYEETCMKCARYPRSKDDERARHWITPTDNSDICLFFMEWSRKKKPVDDSQQAKSL